MSGGAGPATQSTAIPGLEPLWRERQFALLVSGQLVNAFGNALALLAIAFAVLRLTGSVADLGYVVAGRSSALAACVLVGGVVADRMPKRTVLVCGNLLAGLSEAAAAALLLSHTARVDELTALQVVNGACSAFCSPASRAVLRQTVSPGNLHQATVVNRFAGNATSILGAAVGGFVIAAAGAGWAVAVDAATFVAAAACFAALRLTTVRRDEAEPKRAGRWGGRHDLAEGWREIRSHTWLWTVIVQFLFVNAAFGGVFYVLGPSAAADHLGGAHAWGVLSSVLSAGFLLGGLCAARLRGVRRPLLVATLGLLPIVSYFALLAARPALVVLCAAALAAGIGIEINSVLWNVTLQRRIPPELLSRVYAFDMFGSLVLLPLGQIAVGPVQAALGLGPAIVLCAALVLVSTIAVLGVRDVRAPVTDPPPPVPRPGTP